MSLAPRLDLRQSQSLVMTPQLQQAIRLLALSNLEIETFIAEELEKNPLLEAGAGGGDSDEAPAPEPEHEGELRDGPADAGELLEMGGGADEAALDVDFSAETFHHDSPSDSIGGLDGSLGMGATAGGAPEDGPDFDSFADNASRARRSKAPTISSRRT
jgi:RNA polymerase sigma-54 factor